MDRREASDLIVEEFPELFSEAFDVSLPPGWYTLAHECCAAIVKIAPDVRAAQLKEKFGGARFYVGGAPPDVHRLIEDFERKSVTVCECCGAPGSQKTSKTMWVRTLCGRCK